MESNQQSPQKLNDGYGATFHRIYSIVIPTSKERVVQSMLDLKRDLNKFSPQLLARFEKQVGEVQKLSVNDEFMIHITGPWNGPVRVNEVSEDGFHLVTLEGHLEAGEIKFRLKESGQNEFVFEIESLARSRDAIVDFVYDKIPIAKVAQTEMWSMFCKNFAEHAMDEHGKLKLGEVDILTERREEGSQKWEKI